VPVDVEEGALLLEAGGVEGAVPEVLLLKRRHLERRDKHLGDERQAAVEQGEVVLAVDEQAGCTGSRPSTRPH
jgi:hypothetical protein